MRSLNLNYYLLSGSNLDNFFGWVFIILYITNYFCNTILFQCHQNFGGGVVEGFEHLNSALLGTPLINIYYT